jgi:predicted CopG family antitoxin
MPRYEKSNIVRTTIDIDDLVLRDLKRLKEKRGKSLGQLISELLAQAIHQLQEPMPKARSVRISRPMKARVNLEDKEALFRVTEKKAARQ